MQPQNTVTTNMKRLNITEMCKGFTKSFQKPSFKYFHKFWQQHFCYCVVNFVVLVITVVVSMRE